MKTKTVALLLANLVLGGCVTTPFSLDGPPVGESRNVPRDTGMETREIATPEVLGPPIAELRSALRLMTETMQDLNRDVLPQPDVSQGQVRFTFEAEDDLELGRMLGELAAVARSMRGMADYLEHHSDNFLEGERGL